MSNPHIILYRQTESFAQEPIGYSQILETLLDNGYCVTFVDCIEQIPDRECVVLGQFSDRKIVLEISQNSNWYVLRLENQNSVIKQVEPFIQPDDWTDKDRGAYYMQSLTPCLLGIHEEHTSNSNAHPCISDCLNCPNNKDHVQTLTSRKKKKMNVSSVLGGNIYKA